MFDFYSKVVLNALLIYIIVIKTVTPNVINKKPGAYNSWISDQGLYDSNDDITILNVTNFKNTIYGSKNAWIVEFYNAYCGHCQKFAPIWKAVARGIVGWKDIIEVAAVDCADYDNNALCRDHKVIHYPTIRYFPPYSKPEMVGENVEKGDSEETMRHKIIAQLQKEQIEEKGVSWPNITPYRSSEPHDTWKGVPDTVLYKFYLFEESDSFLGSEVILDLRNITNIQIRRIICNGQWLCMMHKITNFPALVVYSRDGNHSRLKISVPTRLGVAQVVEDYLKSKGLIINAKEINEPIIHEKTQIVRRNQTNTSFKFIGDVLYQADLDLALKYSLEREIPLVKTIDGLKMKALKDYLRALALYFPMKHGNPAYLPFIRDAIENKTMISGGDFRELVESAEKKMHPVYSGKEQWISCKGSISNRRGYPCGLWSLFHTLTVNYAAADEEDTPVDTPERILAVMYGYIKNFFGCSDCAEHFVEMAEKQKLFEVESTDEAVLWLWRAHNQVNSRLSGDITEDPEFPKIQYPSKKDCPQCRNDDGTWNEVQVFNYLKKKYTTIQSDTSVAELHLDRDEFTRSRNVTDQHKVGWDFTVFDISICVIIYILSATILVLVCIKFVVKRSSKKKLQIQNLLGKV
ncbi:sulfhydryl oxidase 2-like [Chelonus insularis]|uniref:sulfhydryl oxidase 2-like n=1 Tax=Chelonus insularis TaxID=460826 RepID=UPI001589A968|nr:sulfhydryl oxidase 2-like [Chelonus insularis]